MKRVLALLAACTWLATSAGATHAQPQAAVAAVPAGNIIDLGFGSISGSTVPDRSGAGNDGAGKKGAIGSETAWNPGTTTDSQGDPAVVFDGAQKERIEIPDRAGSLNVNHFSILVRFTLNELTDTDPAHQRYELMEKAGSFWFNVREDTSPKYRLRVGGFFNGRSVDNFTGNRVIPSNTLTWAIATYDGAHLTTYVANGDGSNLALDKSVAQTGTLNTGATITGIDENLVVGAKHRKGHAPGGSGTKEDLEAFFNGSMSRFLVFNTALTQSQISSLIGGSAPPSGTPGPVQAAFVQKSAMSTGASPTVPYKVSWTQGTCVAGATYRLTVTTGGSSSTPFTGAALSTTVSLPVGATSTIAVDCGGPSSSSTFTSAGFQEGAASYTGTWTTTSFTGAWGGTAKYATAANASSTFACASCSAIAWVTDEDSQHGSAKVYVDGVLKATVNTNTSSKKNRVIAYTFGWAGNGPHTLKIVNAATSGHPRVTVDGFLTRS
ncbi:MAG: LamG-like jellyroll fold domain-containing protein [Myxococcales bacterium]